MLSPDVNRIVDDILASRRAAEGASFTQATYHDQPLLMTGRQFRERKERARAQAEGGHVPTQAQLTLGAQEVARGAAGAPRVSGPAREAPRVAVPEAHGAYTRVYEQGAFGHTLRSEPVPERYRAMQKIARDLRVKLGERRSSFARGNVYGLRQSALVFYRQARFMEDWEDEYEYHGNVVQYYPTYEALSIGQLRGYFSWRTKVRAGEVPWAPATFAYLLAYELICGIGAAPGREGLEALDALAERYGEVAGGADARTFLAHMARWHGDYCVYYGVEPRHAAGTSGAEAAQDPVLTLLAAERAELARQGLPPREDNPFLQDAPAPSGDELAGALIGAAGRQTASSRLVREHGGLFGAVAVRVFCALVGHCARRRKTDYVEGLFGAPSDEPVTLFSAAVFHEPALHADARVKAGPGLTYVCENGAWRRQRPYDHAGGSAELAATLQEVDRQLREAIGFGHALKERPCAAYLKKLIAGAIAEELAARAEAERRTLTIDRSKLGSIRASAAWATEALLVDEEREADAAEGTAPSSAGVAAAAVAPSLADAPALGRGDSPRANPDPKTHQDSGGDGDTSCTTALAASGGVLGLSASEAGVLSALLSGTDPSAALGAGELLSVVVDRINETLFDILGDAGIAYEGDAPAIVEDYREDILEALA